MDKWVVVAAGLVLAGIGYGFRLAGARATASALQGREAMSDEAIYERFYAVSGIDRDVVKELWHEIALVLHVPAQHLRPTDRFGKDIGVSTITSEELDELGALAKRRVERQGLNVDLPAIETVDDYVRQLAATRAPAVPEP